MGIDRRKPLRSRNDSSRNSPVKSRPLCQSRPSHTSPSQLNMFLRHKPSFLRPKPPISAVKVSSIIYHDQHPDEHYEPVTHVTSATWIATHRRRMSRQLAVIQLLSHYHIASLDGFYHIAHVHVAQPVATYHNATGIYLVYEYVDLDFREILPLSQPEIAALMHQVGSFQTIF